MQGQLFLRWCMALKGHKECTELKYPHRWEMKKKKNVCKGRVLELNGKQREHPHKQRKHSTIAYPHNHDHLQRANNLTRLETLDGTHGGNGYIQVWEREINTATMLRQIMVPIGTVVDFEIQRKIEHDSTRTAAAE